MLLEAVGSRSAKATVWSFWPSVSSSSWSDLSEALEELIELQVVSCISLISVSYGSVAGCDFSDGSIFVVSTNPDYSTSLE
jgi:hypothetical protein